MSWTMESFTLTTADDQLNYFSGSQQTVPVRASGDAIPEIKPGTYRIIDGKMCHIVSGLHPEIVRTKLMER